ncbi:hypothetical protein Mx8p22 [Myxococcus phage Mx8]|uniref:p22 n=1 Tax=Myxococcus phage Mx8 TaxID=49964 RepID=Q94MU7_9CAUD|nr:hypothetical protein Mx8p22 [Myxococcus phage Mx8]AAK94357.1 p22 [Myxococcus phage Mx8]
MSCRYQFMGEQEDADLDVVLSRGMTRVYDGTAAPRSGRVGCPIAGCPDAEAEDTLCEAHWMEFHASPERAEFMARRSTFAEAGNAFGRRLGVKEGRL